MPPWAHRQLQAVCSVNIIKSNQIFISMIALLITDIALCVLILLLCLSCTLLLSRALVKSSSLCSFYLANQVPYIFYETVKMLDLNSFCYLTHHYHQPHRIHCSGIAMQGQLRSSVSYSFTS